jgi:hypothetical protein
MFCRSEELIAVNLQVQDLNSEDFLATVSELCVETGFVAVRKNIPSLAGKQVSVIQPITSHFT